MGIRYHLFFRVILGFTAIITFVLLGAYIFTVWRSINADVERLDHIFESTTSKGLEELETSLHLALEDG